MRTQRRRLRNHAALGLLLVFAACSDPSTTPETAIVATAVDPATAGTIEVEVLYEGAVPEARKIDMRAVPKCAEAHPEPVYDNSLVVHDGRLANAVVWIKEGLQGRIFATPTQPAVIDQVGCLYQPRVSAAMIGQPIEFRNSDPEPHNVRGRPQVVSSWNFMIARKGASKTLKFDKSEVAVPLGCDIHPWMRGYLAIVDSPYFAITSGGAPVALKSVPPGEYVVAVWHETLGAREERVKLEPTATARVRAAFQAK